VQAVCSSPSSFGSQTIAIVDAYQDPNIESDLGVYDMQYGLPPCTQTNGCLHVVDMCAPSKGRYRKYSCYTATQGWALEASMDVEIAHAVCQTCKILFVESYYADLTDMGNAENTAVQDGATEVSNSWSTNESLGESQYDGYWNHPGAALLFAAGDGGYGAQYPAVAPTVLAVGGTTLTLNANNTYSGEAVWWNAATGQGTGSGCSAYEPANSWQTSLPNWSSTGCGSFRPADDIAADADPNTGAAVYDSFGYYGTTGWYQVGGTSLATPLAAAVIALAGGTAAYANADEVPYLKMNVANSHNVTVGSNGTCNTTMCTAGTGYNGPTGLGTPNGTGGF
jgi:subtilase family serine protease